MMGKEVEVVCQAASITGKVIRVDPDVLYLEKGGVTCYVNIDKIVVIWDTKERKIQPPGFLPRVSWPGEK